jgi:hypothetical protein
MGLKSGGLQAGGVRNLSEISDIPDSGMFQSPIYQFWAGGITASDGSSSVSFPDVLGGLSDATAVGGPIYRTDQNGKEAVEYDGTDDGHDWTPDSKLPTGSDSFSIAALVYMRDTSLSAIVNVGNQTTNEVNRLYIDSGNIIHAFWSNNLAGGSLSTNTWLTLGVRYDGSNRKLYIDGSPDASDSPGSVNVQDTNHQIAHKDVGGAGSFTDGYISEIIWSDVAESDQAFSDYHTDRLG